MSEYEDGLPIEEFIQALTSQLDRAQATMALKAQAGLPLTFAIKDISVELRTHVNMVRNRVLIRPASPGDAETSVLHISLTTITRPMIEENTLRFAPDEPSLNEVLGDDLDEDDKRRLEWAGVRTVSQLRELQRTSGEHVIGQIAQIPALRLRKALERASQPHISRMSRDQQGLVRVQGLNLAEGGQPLVRVDGEDVTVLEASDRELVLSPLPHQLVGTLALEMPTGAATQVDFDLVPEPNYPAKHAPDTGGNRGD